MKDMAESQKKEEVTLLLLEKSLGEIKSLRARNQIMAARLDMFDKVVELVNIDAPRRGGMSDGMDIAWDLENYIAQSKSVKTTQE